MPAQPHLYLAPAAAGKTAYALTLARETARHLAAEARVCVATRLQVRAGQRRLAQAGGAIGVRVFTFDDLVAECLNAAGEAYTRLSEPVQYRLLRASVDQLPLNHYQSLTDKPGFIQVLQDLIRELKVSKIDPQHFRQAVVALGDEPRLRELADIYAAYQEQLQRHRWADWVGLHWLAVELLTRRAPHVAKSWPLLVVDGFDSFTPVQLDLLHLLSHRVDRLIITLTGTADAHDKGKHNYRRFQQTRQRVEEVLQVKAEPLPAAATTPATPTLGHLATNLFTNQGTQAVAADGTVHLIEAPDQVAEVRAALRWLKERLVLDGRSPQEVALLARDVTPYRPFIVQTAKEFGLPIRLVDGLPLARNPAVAALLDLLRLALPEGNGGGPALPRRLVIAAWRSPYFDWSGGTPDDGNIGSATVRPGDADVLDRVARHGRVIGGMAQWQAALEALSQRRSNGEAEETVPLPAELPTGAEAQQLQARFDRFWQHIAPPVSASTIRHFVSWLEYLIGPDPESSSDGHSMATDPGSLNIVAQARVEPTTAERDVAALNSLKDVLRGLVWAEEAIPPPKDGPPIDFSRFFSELFGAIEATSYRPPLPAEGEEILVANVTQARGLPFTAVAVLGLAEGLFPAILGEDPFLRDADRKALRDEFDLLLEPSTLSAEREYFYETVTRPTSNLLLTRPRLAESGAEWVASPFWDEVHRLVEAAPTVLSSESVVRPQSAASWPELLESCAVHSGAAAVQEWGQRTEPAHWRRLQAASRLCQQRQQKKADAYDGELTHLAPQFSDRFGRHHVWSASRLEAYRTCPYLFFVANVLKLEPRAEPEEGMDVRQLGNVYHHVFEAVYRDGGPPADLDEAQTRDYVTEAVTPILEAAPAREGFRQTAWWAQTQQEILDNVTRSVMVLAERAGDFTPLHTEAAFWEPQALRVSEDGDTFQLHGFIDRVDRDDNGRIRVIDYKLGSPASFTPKDVTRGKKLQLPLYALAAQEALGLGRVVDGFYWHFQKAEPSSFTLAKFDGGVKAAFDTAVAHAWTAVRGARAGKFTPQPPDDGCPSYCPAAAFCWRYESGFRG